mmetsp:Transcript_54540/g.115860  ORF Transcript_54540/g.115860 Transcript_54540/m.115860 type:complete len:109 (-) Transcript_54540:43-369(-)
MMTTAFDRGGGGGIGDDAIICRWRRTEVMQAGAVNLCDWRCRYRGRCPSLCLPSAAAAAVAVVVVVQRVRGAWWSVVFNLLAFVAAGEKNATGDRTPPKMGPKGGGYG